MNDLEHITFPPSYYIDEVREGFYVSGMMKHFWAAQLSVLAEIDRVCKRHGLRWWADNGTLLGAVRHAGYIPWDDDIDIVMMRDDLEHFLAVAKEEMPADYALLNVRISDYEYLITQVTNGFVIGLEGEALARNRGCPYITGVDIFILDGIFPDESKDEARNALVCDVDRAAAYVKEGRAESDACRALLKKIESDHGIRLPRNSHLYHALLSLEEDLFALCPVSETDAVAQMIFWPMKHSHRYEKSWYEDTVYLPFEMTLLPVPARYDEVLRTEYGDYMRIVKGGSSHAYPVFSNQEELLKKKAGHYPNRYTFAKDDLAAQHAAPRTERIAQMTSVIARVDAQVKTLQAAGDTESANRLLLGAKQVLDTLDALERDHAEIVFLAVKHDWWQGVFEALWRAAVADKDMQVRVIAVPYMLKNTDGTPGEAHSDRDLFPAEVQPLLPEEFDLGAHQPDIILTHFPFDGTHDTIVIPPGFHTAQLRNCCDRLIYLPYLYPETPAADNATLRSALMVLAEQPSTVFADRTYLPSAETAGIFIDTMTRIAGEETRTLWTKKIRSYADADEAWIRTACAQIADTDAQSRGTDADAQTVRADADTQPRESPGAENKKRLLFYVSCAFLMEHRERALEKMRSVLEILSAHTDRVTPLWVTQDEGIPAKRMPKLWAEYLALQDMYTKKGTGQILDAKEAEDVLKKADAFYGCAGTLAHRMRLLQKPVMIMNADVR